MADMFDLSSVTEIYVKFYVIYIMSSFAKKKKRKKERKKTAKTFLEEIKDQNN
jgi:hypothetical protein